MKVMAEMGGHLDCASTYSSMRILLCTGIHRLYIQTKNTNKMCAKFVYVIAFNYVYIIFIIYMYAILLRTVRDVPVEIYGGGGGGLWLF